MFGLWITLPAFLLIANSRDWPISFFQSELLSTVSVPSPSEIVQSEIGTPSVAEASALLAAGVGALSLGASNFLMAPLLSLVSWYVWAYIIYFVGVKLLPDPQTKIPTSLFFNLILLPSFFA